MPRAFIDVAAVSWSSAPSLPSGKVWPVNVLAHSAMSWRMRPPDGPGQAGIDIFETEEDFGGRLSVRPLKRRSRNWKRPSAIADSHSIQSTTDESRIRGGRPATELRARKRGSVRIADRNTARYSFRAHFLLVTLPIK